MRHVLEGSIQVRIRELEFMFYAQEVLLTGSYSRSVCDDA